MGAGDVRCVGCVRARIARVGWTRCEAPGGAAVERGGPELPASSSLACNWVIIAIQPSNASDDPSGAHAAVWICGLTSQRPDVVGSPSTSRSSQCSAGAWIPVVARLPRRRSAQGCLDRTPDLGQELIARRRPLGSAGRRRPLQICAVGVDRPDPLLGAGVLAEGKACAVRGPGGIIGGGRRVIVRPALPVGAVCAKFARRSGREFGDAQRRASKRASGSRQAIFVASGEKAVSSDSQSWSPRAIRPSAPPFQPTDSTHALGPHQVMKNSRSPSALQLAANSPVSLSVIRALASPPGAIENNSMSAGELGASDLGPRTAESDPAGARAAADRELAGRGVSRRPRARR